MIGASARADAPAVIDLGAPRRLSDWRTKTIFKQYLIASGASAYAADDLIAHLTLKDLRTLFLDPCSERVGSFPEYRFDSKVVASIDALYPTACRSENFPGTSYLGIF